MHEICQAACLYHKPLTGLSDHLICVSGNTDGVGFSSALLLAHVHTLTLWLPKVCIFRSVS